jgi:hypothetical protein
MSIISIHSYNHVEDYQRVSDFLIANYQPNNADGNPGALSRGNWIEPAWEYMHFHPALESGHPGKLSRLMAARRW